jgi:hypothetical protein
MIMFVHVHVHKYIPVHDHDHEHYRGGVLESVTRYVFHLQFLVEHLLLGMPSDSSGALSVSTTPAKLSVTMPVNIERTLLGKDIH